MDGLLVDGRGGYSAGFEDAVDGLPLNGSRGEGAAGVAGAEEGGEVHGYLVFLVIPELTPNLTHSRYALPDMTFLTRAITTIKERLP